MMAEGHFALQCVARASMWIRNIEAYFIGPAPTSAAALSFAVDESLIDHSRELGWLAHPSTSGGSKVSIYLGERKVEQLSNWDPVRYRAGTLVTAATAMRGRIDAAARNVVL